MTFEELRQKAHSLPMEPGVYLMHNGENEIIYVGKARHLRNRVSQYFQDSASHTPKTRAMVEKIRSFEVIVAASEFEALVLECSLIKRHQPKYNILLKDDKGYPFVRVDLRREYPTLSLSNKALQDGAEYFGPFGSRFLTNQLLDALRLTFRLPGCSRELSAAKGRVCLNYQMGNCAGWCQPSRTPAQYREVMGQVVDVLRGNYQPVAQAIRAQMNEAAEKLEFERAAQLRDRLHGVEALGQKQLVTARAMADVDAVGYQEADGHACFVVLHYMGGSLIDKDYEIVEPLFPPEEMLCDLLKAYYLSRRTAPKTVLLPMALEDAPLLEQLLGKEQKIRFRVPQRGDNVRLTQLAQKNAREEAQRLATREDKLLGRLKLLQNITGLPMLPRRLESYDISNLSGTDTVASMVVFVDGKPLKNAYRHFKIEDLPGQDDYAAMRQVLRRRFTHYLQGDAGFEIAPDALLIDGGVGHAAGVWEELTPMGITIPIFGMVKDGRHRTRALVTPQGQELGIAGVQAVFSLIGQIQEETHRFAITYHKKLRSKRMQHSVLEEIPGIGPQRRKALMSRFRTIQAISDASVEALCEVLPRPVAQSVFDYFEEKQK